MAMAQKTPRTLAQRIRGLWPYAVGLAIVAFLATRVPFGAFKTALHHGPHLQLASFICLVIAMNLLVDTYATWMALYMMKLRRAFKDILIVRGATYLLSLIHYGLGQGGIGFYLHRTGTSAAHATGAVLFMMGINVAVLALIAGTGVLIAGPAETGAAVEWTILAAVAGLALYLVVIAIRPRFLARFKFLEPLFDTGLRGHAVAAFGRLPHVIWFIVSSWLAMRVWGIHVPFLKGMLFLPAVGLVSALPITPAGLGTAQAAMLYFFRDYAPGATPDERSANLLAYAMVYYVYAVAGFIAVGVSCLPGARRAQAPAAETDRAA